MSNYVCFDIGASSGKMCLGKLQNGKIEFEKIHTFKNLPIKKKNNTIWDVDSFFNELIIGLKKVKKLGIEKCFLGIDTWAVDYVLIDKEGKKIGDAFSYRDKRTNNFFKNNKKDFDRETLYMETGITPHEFNTLFQLYTQNISEMENLDKVLLLPDYFIYKLTGKFVAEATNLSTTHLFDSEKKEFNTKWLNTLSIDSSKFGKLVFPGDEVGKINDDLRKEFDLPECTVIAVASHDTSSAIAAAPLESKSNAFISSGTWSLLGTELDKKIITKQSFKKGFTNQLGVENTNTFLKNIVGMWILQEIENNLSNKFDISELLEEALKNESFNFIMDCEDERYLNPENMIFEIWKYFDKTRQTVPYNIGALIRCVVDSLALCYCDNLNLLSEITGQEINTITIIGGGSKNKILNQQVANISNKTVIAGPVDATLIGNLVTQMISRKEIKDLKDARKIIAKSFEIEKFNPDGEDYRAVINKYQLIKEMRKE